ncbi:MAG: LAGLIDADG family homing endonuclease [Actinomycetota bacterium]
MAMAPEKAGIGLRRHFTVEGVDPYERGAGYRLDWERRDARITNYRDGSVAFEQRDVEFPVPWSQNATNIVAQKYFRGSLGSPERERSLRQVVDRVVETIAAWGEKGGYFVDGAEADAFRAELKHLVVTQKAAFNSPVWFNIGVAGEPQQASACQPWHALVSTPEGLVPIGALVEQGAVGAKVCDAHGLTSVVAVKANGRKTVLRLHTSAGYVLDVTGDHLVWRARPGEAGSSGGEFVPARQITRGDLLEWHQAESWGNGQITREAVAEAGLAGWVQAGGFVVDVGGKGVAGGQVAVSGEAEETWLRQSLAAALPGVRAERAAHGGRLPGVPGARLRLEGTGLAPFVQRWGLARQGVEATVPDELFNAPLPVAAGYLRSLFQAEGWVSDTGSVIGLAMVSEALVRGAQSLLLRFGIFSRVRRVAEQRAGGNLFWVLNVSVGSDGRRFADEIGFIGPDRTRELEAALAKAAPGGGRNTAVRTVEVESVEVLGETEVYDIQTESGEYLSGNLRVHNCFILAVDDTMRSILNWYVEEGTIFKGGSGAGINLSNIRSSKETLKGGGLASGPVSFMRGADASAGTIKCLGAGTPVVTDRGVIAIEDTVAGDQVLTRFGFRPVDAVHANGTRPLVRVQTALGDEVLCTPEHRFWVRGRDGEGWREARFLRPDDHVLVDVGGAERGRLQPLARPGAATGAGAEGDGGGAGVELPTHLDEAFAMWLGWAHGEGPAPSRSGAKFVAVQIGGDDPEVVARYTDLTRAVFGPGVHIHAERHPDPGDGPGDHSVCVRFASAAVNAFLEANGLRREANGEPRVPAVVQASPATARAAFLSGLFEADGHVGNGYAWMSAPTLTMAQDVHRLLLSLGIPSTIGALDDRGAHGRRLPYTVRVVGREGMRRFAKQVGFVSHRKHQRLEAAVAGGDASPYETQWSLPHTRAEIDRLWAGTGNAALRRALAPYRRAGNPRRISLLRARALLDRFPDELASTRLARFAYGDELFAPVTVEPAGEGPTFDLTVAGVHEYLVNNLVTHNSGGKTRRAAKMVILNADHPDVEDFIWCKAVEERKARVLRDAGFDMDLDGRDSHSTQYQNANNSVRVTDEFMQAVVDDRDWHMRAVTTGDTVRTLRARDLFRQIAEAAWECADPGMQFDTTINRWHTASNTGRINGSNPCFPGDQLVHTDKGLVRFSELFDRAREGESFGVYTHDATNPDAPAQRVVVTRPEAFMVTGVNEIVRLRFANGAELRCTPNHSLFTTNRGWVAAAELTADDRVRLLDVPAPATGADSRLPAPAGVALTAAVPEKWSPELAHYLGWLVGNGSLTGEVATTAYGRGDGQADALSRHFDLLGGIGGDRPAAPAIEADGTVRLRQSSRVLARLLQSLGAGPGTADATVPWSVEQAPGEVVLAFLTGLFESTGQAGGAGERASMTSTSAELLRGAQRLLSTLGLASSVQGGELTVAATGRLDDLAARAGAAGAAPGETRLVSRDDDGVELTYNLSEPRNHSYVVGGFVVRNCSEYMHLDNSACNLASLNLLKFLDDQGDFDVEGFKQAVEVVFTAQEILVGNADYPTERIAETSRRFRQLGLGYANLGAMLMALGLPYDSDEGRAWAGSITALMTGHAYATSSRIASRMGPFAGYSDNTEPMNRVLRQHRDATHEIDRSKVPGELLAAAQDAWDTAVELCDWFGVRNSQATVLAPTGTIGLMMDCDTTGIEPDLGLCKTKKLVGGGTMSIVNQTVPRALRRLGYDEGQVADIIAYIDEHKSIVGAPHLAAEHLAVFACSMGDNVIHYSGHVRMMGAAQPFISGAISKTINTPEDTSVTEIEQLHIDAWRLGLKAVAIYRDNCKVAQPLSTTKKASLSEPVEKLVATVVREPVREKLPRRRNSKTFSFRVADCHGYVTVGEYDDGRPGEIFLKVAKQGSTLAGIMDAFAISVSHGLQYGVPLKAFIDMYTNMRFEPAGMTDDPDLRFASSLVDYIFRRLAVEYLDLEERSELGILTVGERMQPTLPGVEESATPSSTGSDVVPDPAPTPVARAAAPPAPATVTAPAQPQAAASDAPYCYQCGMVMQRAGACFVCSSCGTTSGCS